MMEGSFVLQGYKMFVGLNSARVSEDKLQGQTTCVCLYMFASSN